MDGGRCGVRGARCEMRVRKVGDRGEDASAGYRASRALPFKKFISKVTPPEQPPPQA